MLSPATAKALGYAVEGEAAVKVSGRKGLGVKADDLIDALERKARAEIESRDADGQRNPDEKDATAASLGYVADTTKANQAKYPNHKPDQMCGNCQLFQGAAGAASGPCPLYSGKSVSAKGWCSAYAKKA